jgi:hypothetical protein
MDIYHSKTDIKKELEPGLRHRSVIPSSQRQRQEDGQSKVIAFYIRRPFSKQKEQKTKPKKKKKK